MATNGHDHEEQVVLAPNNNNQNNNNNNQALNESEQLIYAMFYKATLWYARICPRSLRMLLEFVFLLKAILSFFVLVYVHMNFSRMSTNCLDHIKDVWSRDGILRVEIIPSFQCSRAEQIGMINELFTIEKSYEREYQLKRINMSEENAPLFNRFTKTDSPENKGEVDIEPSTEELAENTFRESNTPKPNLFNYLSFTNYIFFKDEKKEIFSSTTKTNHHTTSKSNFSTVEDSEQFCSTEYSNSSIRSVLGIDSLFQSINTKLPSIDNHKVIINENYIVEYSLEFESLLLPPKARNRLSIPVMLVVLDPTRNKCFGNSLGQFVLEYIIGYDYLLRSAVQTLTENQHKNGFLRNVITEEYFAFVSISVGRKSYISSFFKMVTYTLLISMYWKYLHKLMFVFMVDLVHARLLNFNISLFVPPVPLWVGILAGIGMTNILTGIFKNHSTAMYITFIIYSANLYNTICSRLAITKRHWLKFFYLYHFSFYAYHYRFNGQYSNLALICSWYFTQHSMIYFYHHYEMPYMLLQAQLTAEAA